MGKIELVDDNDSNNQTDNGIILRNCCDRIIENCSVIFVISDYKKPIDELTEYAHRKAKMKDG